MQLDWSNEQLTDEILLDKIKELIMENNSPSVTSINVSNNAITSLDFIEIFQQNNMISNLRILNISNNSIEKLQLSHISTLMTLDCSRNPIRDIEVRHLSSLKSIDARNCNIDDMSFVQLLQSGINLRHLRLGKNEITDLGVSAITKDKKLEKLLCETMMTLDLKDNNTQFTNLQLVREQIDSPTQKTYKSSQNSLSKLPSLNNSQISSRSNSARSTADSDLFSLLDNIYNTSQRGVLKKNYPQALAAVMLGNSHELVQKAADLCHGNCISGICAALYVGVHAQPDLEEQIAFGFARKVNTIFCKDIKTGVGKDCRERCRTVIEISQKKIIEQNK